MSKKREPLLIVEDDPALQKQMRWGFDGYEVVLADDRESALAQLRRHEPAGEGFSLRQVRDQAEREAVVSCQIVGGAVGLRYSGAT